MHVEKKKKRKNHKCQSVYLNSWKSKETEDKKTARVQFSEKYIGKTQIQDVTYEKYLGNIINSDGSNMQDKTAKCSCF